MNTDRYDPHEHADYLNVEDCAMRMQISTTHLMHLVHTRALKAIHLGDGLILIQPAILSGIT